MKILSIDPGNIESGYVITDRYVHNDKGKVLNNYILELLETNEFDYVAIEMIASYGMAVGKTVFDTCVWIGMFKQASLSRGFKVRFVYRKDVKMALCGNVRAKDTNIKQALIDRFDPDATNHGKGNKKDPGYFYGFKSDIWSAYAVAVTFLDYLEK